MNKQDIESILLANFYLTACSIKNPICDKTELARKYLTKKIGNILHKKRVNKAKPSFFFIF